MTITVTPVNNAPVAIGAVYEIKEDTVLNGALQGRDEDSDPSTFTFAVKRNPQHGSVELLDGTLGTFAYTPKKNYFVSTPDGVDTFEFDVTVRDNTHCVVSMVG